MDQKRKAPSVVARLMGLETVPEPEAKKTEKSPEHKYSLKSAFKGLFSRTVHKQEEAQSPEKKQVSAPPKSEPSLHKIKTEQELRQGSESGETQLQEMTKQLELTKQLVAKQMHVRAQLKEAREYLANAGLQERGSHHNLSESREFADALDLLQLNKDFFLNYFQESSSRSKSTPETKDEESMRSARIPKPRFEEKRPEVLDFEKKKKAPQNGLDKSYFEARQRANLKPSEMQPFVRMQRPAEVRQQNAEYFPVQELDRQPQPSGGTNKYERRYNPVLPSIVLLKPNPAQKTESKDSSSNAVNARTITDSTPSRATLDSLRVPISQIMGAKMEEKIAKQKPIDPKEVARLIAHKVRENVIKEMAKPSYSRIESAASPRSFSGNAISPRSFSGTSRASLGAYRDDFSECSDREGASAPIFRRHGRTASGSSLPSSPCFSEPGITARDRSKVNKYSRQPKSGPLTGNRSSSRDSSKRMPSSQGVTSPRFAGKSAPIASGTIDGTKHGSRVSSRKSGSINHRVNEESPCSPCSSTRSRTFSNYSPENSPRMLSKSRHLTDTSPCGSPRIGLKSRASQSCSDIPPRLPPKPKKVSSPAIEIKPRKVPSSGRVEAATSRKAGSDSMRKSELTPKLSSDRVMEMKIKDKALQNVPARSTTLGRNAPVSESLAFSRIEPHKVLAAQSDIILEQGLQFTSNDISNDEANTVSQALEMCTVTSNLQDIFGNEPDVCQVSEIDNDIHVSAVNTENHVRDCNDTITNAEHSTSPPAPKVAQSFFFHEDLNSQIDLTKGVEHLSPVSVLDMDYTDETDVDIKEVIAESQGLNLSIHLLKAMTTSGVEAADSTFKGSVPATLFPENEDVNFKETNSESKEDMLYIKRLLVASGFFENNISLDSQKGLRSPPIDLAQFEVLEAHYFKPHQICTDKVDEAESFSCHTDQSNKLNLVDGKEQTDPLTRLLLFDLTNEILANQLASCLRYTSGVSQRTEDDAVFSGRQILEKVSAEMCKYRQAKSYPENCIKDEFSTEAESRDLKEEIRSVATEIEMALFNELVVEIIFDLRDPQTSCKIQD